MYLFYIRHGDPTYNPNCLTPYGKRQAEAVGRRLSHFGMDKVFASTSKRAIETSMPLCEILKKEPTLLDFANESHAWHDMSVVKEDGSRTWAVSVPEYRMNFVREDVRQLGYEWYRHECFGEYREAFENGVKRVDAAVDEWLLSLGYRHDRENHCFIGEAPNNDRVALFAHAGFSGLFFSSLLDIPYPQFATRFGMELTGVCLVRFDDKEGPIIPHVETYSNDGHLYADDLPTKF